MKRFLFQTSDGHAVPVTISDSVVISKVKAVVGDMVGVAPQDLTFRYNDQVLHDDTRLSDADIPNNGVVTMIIAGQSVRKVTVLGPNGKVAKTRFNEAATVNKAKTTLAKIFGISGDVNLVCESKILPPEARLSDLDLPEDAVLRLEEAPTSLRIYSDSGKVAVTRFKPQVTVGKVKGVMAAKFGIEPELAVAKYNGKVLGDDETLGSLGITSDGRLEVVKGRMAQEIRIKLADGKVAKSRFTEDATVGKMKEVLAQALKTDPANISFNVDDPNVDDASFVKDLGVDTIEASVASPARSTSIKFDLGEESLEPESSKAEHVRVAGEKRKQVEVARAVRFRLPNGKVAKSRFKDSATVGKAKEKLGKALGVAPSFVSFDVPADDDTLMCDVPFPSSGVINVSIPVELSKSIGSDSMVRSEEEVSLGNVSPIRTITIRVSDGKIAKARFKETATIGKVKEVMAKALYTQPENVSIPNLEEDDRSLIKDINIPEDGLYIERTSPKIKVVKPLVIKFEDGTIVQSRFRLAATVNKVKHALASVAKKPVDKIDLIFDDKKLDDNMLISQLDIPDDGFLFVHTRK